MDAYQNLISGDKRSKITQGNYSRGLLPCFRIKCNDQLDKLEFGGESPRTSCARCSAFRDCPDPLGIITAEQLEKLEFVLVVYSTVSSSSVLFLPNKINSNGEKLDIIEEIIKLSVKENKKDAGIAVQF